jgi:preprotein translocase SecE subunit
MADTIRSPRDFVGDVQTEMKKVTWPDWPQLKNSTYVIIVFVLVVALIIFGMDFVVNNALELLAASSGAERVMAEAKWYAIQTYSGTRTRSSG